jgi:hypothetical protein
MEIKPQAMAMPRDTKSLPQGRYGPIFPKSPACHGFTIIAKVKEGREEAVREYGNTIEKAVGAYPDSLAPLKLHYLRWVLFDIGAARTYNQDHIARKYTPGKRRLSIYWSGATPGRRNAISPKWRIAFRR